MRRPTNSCNGPAAALAAAALATLLLAGCAGAIGGDDFATQSGQALGVGRGPYSGDPKSGLNPIPWPREANLPQRTEPGARRMTREPSPYHQPTVARPQAEPSTPSGGPVPLRTPETKVEPSVPPKQPAALPAPKAELPAPPTQPKVAAAAPPQKVATPAESIARARDLLKRSQLAAARQILTAPPLAEDPDALMALAETYDPLVLGASPNLHGAADAEKATELYLSAVAKGNMAAARRLSALQASRNPPKP